MGVFVIYFMCLVYAAACVAVGMKRDIYIAGLFPTSDEIPEGAIGRGVRPAVELALQHINNDSRILKDYTLKMTWNDTKCDMAMATRVFFDMMDDRNSTKVILFGDACFKVTGPISQISKWWHMFQLSYGDTNPLLSERDKYPYFFRTVPSENDHNPARVALLRHFNWTRVGTLFQLASTGSSRFNYAHNRLITLLEKSNIDLVKVESFADEADAALENLKVKDVRIIFGNFNEDLARRVFCSAHKKQMFGSRYQWIILGGYSKDWWRKQDPHVACTVAEMNHTIHGYLATDALPISSSTSVTESGLTPQSYKKLYDEWRGDEYSKYHGYAYDGVWVVAKAIHSLLDREALFTENTFRSGVMGKVLNETSFIGVTGRVQFNNGDRLGEIQITQMQGGTMQKVAEYHGHVDKLFFSPHRNILWRGNGPPADKNIEYEEMRRVSVPVYSSLCVLAAVGIVMSMGFLSVNIIYRSHRFIKMSSPNMNNLIIAGSFLCYLSVFLLGIDGGVVSPTVFLHLCRLRAWTLTLGFTLAFGAMFSKTWRVHAIFTNIKLNKKVIKDYKLFLIVCVLVLIDAGILVAWQVFDPLVRATKPLAAEVFADYEIIPVIEYCTSDGIEIWLGSIYAYKGLLLVFGCFLAWETRHVSIPALNDSKYIGMSVYNVVIMCVCGGAVSFIIKDRPNSSFIIICLFIIFCTTITLCLVFMPKIYQLRRGAKGDEKRVRATMKRTVNKSLSDTSELQLKIKNITEENKKLRQTVEQKATEIEHLAEQLGEEVTAYDLGVRSAVHKKVLELRLSDVSPSKLSRSSASDGECTSTYSEISGVTSILVDSPPPSLRHTKTKLLTDRLKPEIIELADLRFKGGGVKTCSVLTPAEEEDDDPFGGVYLGPPDSLPPKKSVQFNSISDGIAMEEHPLADKLMGTRGRHDSEVSSDTDRDRMEPLNVANLQGITVRLTSSKLSRARSLNAPRNIWPITETEELDSEEAEDLRIPLAEDAKLKSSETDGIDGDKVMWAMPKLHKRHTPQKVVFTCDIVEDI